jgi:hypothetical protein
MIIILCQILIKLAVLFNIYYLIFIIQKNAFITILVTRI